MKFLTLSFLIIGSLAAHQAYAQDVSPQPLTRADCDKARMAWDANANVCVVASARRLHRRRQTQLRPVSSSTSTNPNKR